jgi:uncharacterized membrane protein
MTEAQSATERFLQQLAAGLEALGPDETNEVLAEIGSHLAEATAEAGGDETTALARFGGPDTLATRILEERGVLAGGSALPQAPLWMQIVAFATDAALWLSACAVVLLIGDLVDQHIFSFVGPLGSVRFFSVWTPFVVAVAVAIWWWTQKHRRWSHATTGMRIMGLRRIHVSQETRIVRRCDVPGLGRGRGARVVPVARTVAVLVFLALFSFWFGSLMWGQRDSNLEYRVTSALSNSSDAVLTVSQVYGAVLAGSASEDLGFLFAPEADYMLSGLVERHAQGELASYDIFSVWLDSDYDSLGFPREPKTEVAMVVAVEEFAEGSPMPTIHQYRVTKTWTSDGTAAESDGFRIQSEQSEQTVGNSVGQ